MVADLTTKAEAKQFTTYPEIIGGQLCLSVIAKDDLIIFPTCKDGLIEIAILMSDENMEFVADVILYRLKAKKREDGSFPTLNEWKKEFYARS